MYVSPTDHTAASPSTISPGSMLPQPEPVTIDETLSQHTFSTFGVQDAPVMSTDNHHHDSCDHPIEKKAAVEKTNSLHKDGLEESHSSFSTFSVPANRYL